MGKITKALKKAADERMERLDKVIKIQEHDQVVARKIQDSTIDARLITYFDPKAVIAEQYKVLTTNLLSLNKTTPPKIMAVTSSTHSEGKTITSLNLAITMSKAVKKPRVLLIDADMRRGRLQRYLGVQPEQGLSELLLDQVSLEDVCFQIDIDNLTFISAGNVPENPAELLASDSMKTLLNKVRNQFDYVIIDTPPIIPVTDPGIIGAQVDGVIMVIQAGRTQRGIVKRANELLYQSHATVLGHVLTNIEYFLPDYIYRYL